MGYELMIMAFFVGTLIGMPIGSLINDQFRKPKRDSRGRFVK